jgi:ketosteroid isomerase-like protein
MGGTIQSDNVATVRTAYEAYSRGDLGTMLGFVDQDLEWTYLDPSREAPEPQVCHGRWELETALANWAEHGLRAELEEVAGNGDRVMVGIRTPGRDELRGRDGDGRSWVVLTLSGGRIVALRDCRDREDARSLAGLD